MAINEPEGGDYAVYCGHCREALVLIGGVFSIPGRGSSRSSPGLAVYMMLGQVVDDMRTGSRRLMVSWADQYVKRLSLLATSSTRLMLARMLVCD